MTTREHLSKVPIFLRVLISAVTGIFLASIFILPSFFWVLGYMNGNKMDFLQAVLFGLVSMIFAAPFLLPLILIAVFVALIFKNSIDQRPLLWCLCAPVCVWLFIAFMFSFGERNDYHKNHSFVEYFFANLMSPDNLLFFFAAIPSALIFYYIRPQENKVVVDGRPH